MKLNLKRLMLVSTLLVSSLSFAATPNAKSSQGLKSLAAGFKSHHAVKLDKQDIEIGYGGQDISHSPLAIHNATA